MKKRNIKNIITALSIIAMLTLAATACGNEVTQVSTEEITSETETTTKAAENRNEKSETMVMFEVDKDNLPEGITVSDLKKDDKTGKYYIDVETLQNAAKKSGKDVIILDTAGNKITVAKDGKVSSDTGKAKAKAVNTKTGATVVEPKEETIQNINTWGQETETTKAVKEEQTTKAPASTASTATTVSPENSNGSNNGYSNNNTSDNNSNNANTGNSNQNTSNNSYSGSSNSSSSNTNSSSGSNNSSPSGSSNSGSNNNSSSSGNNNSSTSHEQPTTRPEQPTTKAPEPETTTSHTHNWEEVSKTVHHDAVYQTVHHDAVYNQVWHDPVTEQRWVVTSPAHEEEIYEYHVCCDCGYDYTVAYANAGVTTSEEATAVREAHMNATGHGGYGTTYVCVGTQTIPEEGYYETVTISEGYTENVLVTAAWDEQVEIQAAYDEKVVTGYKCSICGATK